MKIKTITCHDVNNFGASLQAYALMKYLQEQRHETVVINYKPPYLDNNIWAVGRRWKKNLILRLLFLSYVIPKRLLQYKRKVKFRQFLNRHLNITENTYRNIQELKSNPPLADIYFAGSDQIWNPSLPNGNDPAFFLNFAPSNAIKASYAASFSISELNQTVFPFMKQMLSSFHHISVREKSGLRILESLGISGGTLVSDPVFLLDESHWQSMCNYPVGEKYVFVYDQENNASIKEAAKALAKAKNLRIFAISGLYPKFYAHKRINNAGPIEFLGLIKNCDYCLTNSFHCMAFSLIFKKQFFLFKRNHENVNSRMLDLLSYLDLEDRVYSGETDITTTDDIDYVPVREKIEKLVCRSKSYIGTVLNSENKAQSKKP